LVIAKGMPKPIKIILTNSVKGEKKTGWLGI